MKPGDTDWATLPESRHARGAGSDHAGTLMAWDEWRNRLHRPVPISRVQIGVADASCDDLDQHFARPRRGHRHFLDSQGLAERPHHRRLHHLHHERLPAESRIIVRNQSTQWLGRVTDLDQHSPDWQVSRRTVSAGPG